MRVTSGHLLRRARLLGVAAPVALVLAVVLPAASASATTTQTWTAQLASVGPTTFSAISCPTTSVCTAVGGGPGGEASIYRSSDGGATWAQETAPPQTVSLQTVSCPTVSFCLASGGVGQPLFNETQMLATSDGGATWTLVGNLDSISSTTSQLQCVTASVCYEVGGDDEADLAVTTNGGRTWTPVDAATPVQDLSCPTTTTCYTVDEQVSFPNAGESVTYEIERWSSGGAVERTVTDHWDQPTRSPLTASISCTTAFACMAVGAGPTGSVLYTTTDGGVTWHSRPMSKGLAHATSVACAAGQRCTIVFHRGGGIDEAATTVTDSKWSTQFIARSANSFATGSLSCPVAGSCHLVGFDTATDALYGQQAAGSVWAASTIATGPGPLSAIACPTDTECVAIGAGVALHTEDGGQSWASAAQPPASTAQFHSLACATAATCVAVGEQWGSTPGAAVERTSDGGDHWSPVAAPSPLDALRSVTCPTATDCVAVGYQGATPMIYSTDAGATWRTSSLAPSGASTSTFLSVSCGTATACMAVGTDVATSSDGGATWTVLSASDAPELTSVSCSSASDCVATGVEEENFASYETAVYATTDGGEVWTMLNGTIGWDGQQLACAAQTCQELASPLVEAWGPSSVSTSFDGGSTWTAATLPASDPVLAGVAQTPDGRWFVVGIDNANGALILAG